MNNIIKLDYQHYQVSFNDDGWINATEAAKKFHREVTQWLRTEETLNYLFALQNALNLKGVSETEINEINSLDSRSSAYKNKILILSKKTGLVRSKSGSPESGGGTWLHPKLAVAFARWLSIEFSIWCDITIDHLVRSRTVIHTNEQVIKLLTLDEADTWEKRFIDSFYRALARVTNTRYLGHRNGTPPIFGKITKEWVYEVALPDYVYQEAKLRCRKGEKVHQYLTPTALKAVEAQIISITSLANGCLDYQDFISRCSQAYTKQGQIKLILPKAS
ncbi:DNA-binding protein [Entomomonas moraniae]|uniref:DNA-binding protein n=1 Tax=Entomomonas moraniae TaxID=2213226 RepID=A0A3S9XD99_9GAMM|nr:KilA-N domain-containing protein [Entomomonas moraniae]AZS50394.1 DNA-binding protein [Entomomonas moraniae]